MKKIRLLILTFAGIFTLFFYTVAQQSGTATQHLEEAVLQVEEEMLLPGTDVETPPSDSIIDFLPESLDVDIQKLLEGWHASYFSNTEEHCTNDDANPYFEEDVYRMRLNRMMTMIPMTYNDVVRKCIDLYAGRSRKRMRYIMGMADYYFPMIEQALDAHHLPLELKYLTIVESALNPVAQSRVGASGLWQFMLPTGKIIGLEINSLIDERLDPEKSTEAACRHLQILYNMYDDWHLALAAYNSGPGTVNRAIVRSGGKMDFWKIINYLPRETRAYVPLFIAAAYIMTYHCEHNICPIRANFSIATDTIMVERALHFDQVADILQIDKEAVRFYNPQYKREIIPGNIQPSILRLPIENTVAFLNHGDSVYRHRMEELLAHCAPVDANEPKSRQERITHTVETGETVYTIANKYGVTAQNLRKWNGVTGSKLAKGKKLTVYIDNGGLAFTPPNTTPSSSEPTPKTASAVNSTQKKPASSTTSATAGSNSGYITYQVKSGDSLYTIAQRYPGVTVQSIQEANGLNTTNLRIGQILKIPQG